MRHTAWHPRRSGAKGGSFDDAGIYPDAVGYVAGCREDACNAAGTRAVSWMERKDAEGASVPLAACRKWAEQTASAPKSLVYPGICLGRRQDSQDGPARAG